MPTAADELKINGRSLSTKRRRRTTVAPRLTQENQSQPGADVNETGTADNALLAACQRFDEVRHLRKRCQADYEAGNDVVQDLWEALSDAEEAAGQLVVTIPPRTPRGLSAKASVASRMIKTTLEPENFQSWEMEIALRLIQDAQVLHMSLRTSGEGDDAGTTRGSTSLDGQDCSHPDDRLLAHLKEYAAIQQRIEADEDGRPVSAETNSLEITAARDLQRALVDAICTARATTWDGIKARASLFADLKCLDLVKDDDALYPLERMRFAIVRDLIGKAA